MNAIHKFEITGMSFSGFKCFANSEELEFGPQTVVTGGNGRGKSSVADAIAFAITGLPFFGERGIDKLHVEQNGDLFISLRFTDENGEAHELARSRKKDRMHITYDGRDIRQSNLTDMFGEKDVFLSIFNPLYFIEELGDDGKKLRERYLPDVPRESVMPLLSDATRALLEEQEFLSPESFLKKQREEIRGLEQDVVYLTGQKDLIEIQKHDAAERVTSLTDRLDALTAERDGLVDKRFQGIDLEGAQEQLVELSARYEEMAKEAPKSADTAAIDEELQTLQRKLGERSAEQYAPKYARPIADFSAKVTELGQKYRREAGLLKGFKAGIACPMCRRPVTEAELPSIRAELQKSVDAIVAEGKNTTAKLDELRALEKKSEETFIQFRDEDTAKYQVEIAEMSRRRAAAIDAAAKQNTQRQKDMDELLIQIRYLSATIECGCLTLVESKRLKACEIEIENCKTELSAAQLMANSSPEDFGAKISAKQEQIEEKKKLLSAMALYVSKRAELLFSCLKMNRVEISLFDVVKTTGEVKDAFKFNYNGRQYDRLSLSEKIRAGMEVSELIKRLTGRNYPQFVDNMESVDDLANVRPSGQVIMAKCVHGTELSIRPIGRPRQELPNAA